MISSPEDEAMQQLLEKHFGEKQKQVSRIQSTTDLDRLCRVNDANTKSSNDAMMLYFRTPERRHSFTNLLQVQRNEQVMQYSLIERLQSYYDKDGIRLKCGEKLYSHENLLRRESLLFNKHIASVLDEIWLATDVDGSKSIDKEEYMTMSRKLQLCLVDDNPNTEKTAALLKMSNDDWDTDRMGHEELDRRRFTLSWFQLADSWTTNIAAKDYYIFLKAVLQNLTDCEEGAVMPLWKEDKDIRRLLLEQIDWNCNQELFPEAVVPTEAVVEEEDPETVAKMSPEEFAVYRKALQVAQQKREAFLAQQRLIDSRNKMIAGVNERIQLKLRRIGEMQAEIDASKRVKTVDINFMGDVSAWDDEEADVSIDRSSSPTTKQQPSVQMTSYQFPPEVLQFSASLCVALSGSYTAHNKVFKYSPHYLPWHEAELRFVPDSSSLVPSSVLQTEEEMEYSIRVKGRGNHANRVQCTISGTLKWRGTSLHTLSRISLELHRSFSSTTKQQVADSPFEGSWDIDHEANLVGGNRFGSVTLVKRDFASILEFLNRDENTTRHVVSITKKLDSPTKPLRSRAETQPIKPTKHVKLTKPANQFKPQQQYTQIPILERKASIPKPQPLQLSVTALTSPPGFKQQRPETEITVRPSKPGVSKSHKLDSPRAARVVADNLHSLRINSVTSGVDVTVTRSHGMGGLKRGRTTVADQFRLIKKESNFSLVVIGSP